MILKVLSMILSLATTSVVETGLEKAFEHRSESGHPLRSQFWKIWESGCPLESQLGIRCMFRSQVVP